MLPTHSVSNDAVADAALRASADDASAAQAKLSCDACEETIEGEAAGHGLYVWTRGEERRYEEPALCAGCATAISATALSLWNMEEEEG